MLITLERQIFTDLSTIGRLTIQGQSWWTIEDFDRGLHQDMEESEILAKKVYGKTAIPYGVYPVWITRSNRFSTAKKNVFTPQIMKVKGFAGIRIHPANHASQLEGCIAPGRTKGIDAVYNSRPAYSEILTILNEVFKEGIAVDIQIIKHV
jgi:hypothetical protein